MLQHFLTSLLGHFLLLIRRAWRDQGAGVVLREDSLAKVCLGTRVHKWPFMSQMGEYEDTNHNLKIYSRLVGLTMRPVTYLWQSRINKDKTNMS